MMLFLAVSLCISITFGLPITENKTCSGLECQRVISMPLVDDMKATLKADLDVTEMNKVLKAYIQQEVQRGVEQAMTDEMSKKAKSVEKSLSDKIENTINKKTNEIRSSLEDRFDSVQGGMQETKPDTAGSTFVRWGRNSCDGTMSSIVYKGYMAGPHHTEKGSGSNFVCLPQDPQTRSFPSDWTQSPGQLYGMGYEFTTSDRSKDSKHVDDKDVPCAVCLTEGKTTLMVPGRISCYSGWTTEYKGFLVSARGGGSAAPTEYVCADGKPEWYGTHNHNQGIIYFVEVKCGSIPCSVYKDRSKLSCVVCSK